MTPVWVVLSPFGYCIYQLLSILFSVSYYCHIFTFICICKIFCNFVPLLVVSIALDLQMAKSTKDVKPTTSTKGGHVLRPIGTSLRVLGTQIILMLTQFGEGVNKSGRAGGVVIQKNGRQRQFKSPAYRTTTSTGRARGLFGTLSNLFVALPDAKQLAWNAGVWKTSDRLGRIVTISGRNAYIRFNANLLNTGQTRMDDAPTVLFPAENVTVPHVVSDDSSHSIEVTYTETSNPSQILVFATAPQKSSIFAPKSGAFKMIGTFDGTTPGPVVLTTQYDAVFGVNAVAGVGKKIYVKLIAISETGNATSPIVVGNSIVA